jgi:hypothetical protein
LGNVIGCSSPYKTWNYPVPHGFGEPENAHPGCACTVRHQSIQRPAGARTATRQCTPANGRMTSEARRLASDPRSVIHTDYVAAVHATRPLGLHQRPVHLPIRHQLRS